MTRQHGRCAAAGNGNLQRPALHPRRQLRAGQCGIVHHIGPHLPRLRSIGHGAVDAGIVGGGNHQPCTLQLRGGEGGGEVGDVPVRGQRRQPRFQCTGHHLHGGPRLQQGRDFAGRNGTATDHQHAAAAQVEK